MSSSSSLAAARRRRVGSQTSVPSQQSKPYPHQSPQQQVKPQNNDNNNPTSPTNINELPHPLILLRQHNAKINSIEDALRKLISQQQPLSDNGETNPTSLRQQFDLTELSDMIMSRVESTMDFKALYENDERLVTEIENLRKIVESQQITINSLNITLHYIIQNLGLSDHNPDATDTLKNINIDNDLILVDERSSIPKEKSVVINEDKNTFKEIFEMGEDEEAITPSNN